MSLNLSHRTAQTHDIEHQQQRLLSADPTCPICHPVQLPIPTNFLDFWRYFSREVAPSVELYNQNSIEIFKQVEVL